MVCIVSDAHCIIIAGRPKAITFWKMNHLQLNSFLKYCRFRAINMIDQRQGGGTRHEAPQRRD